MIKPIVRIKSVRLIPILWPLLLIIFTYTIIRISIKYPLLIEKFYSEGFYTYFARVVSTISNTIPFSVWDMYWTMIIAGLIVGLVMVLLKRIRLTHYGLRILQLAALLYAYFYFAWGLNYFRPGIEARMKWNKPKSDEIFFKSILDTIINQCNRNYTSLSPDDYPEIDRLVEDSYRNNSTRLGLTYPNGSRVPKTMIFSSFFAKSGVSGYFGPFFNEVHLNYYLLPMEYPFILGHEKAHQFGITNEAEANLTAFIICSTSSDKRIQYSAYTNLLLYFLSDAAHLKDIKEYMNKIDKRVILDLRFERSHWMGLRNATLDRAQSAANNAYLKTNHIEEGIKNYNQVVGLVLNWYFNKKDKDTQ